MTEKLKIDSNFSKYCRRLKAAEQVANGVDPDQMQGAASDWGQHC